jgi:hypothetical protein
VPKLELPPTTPFTLQITPALVLPVTVAVYCADVPRVTVAAPLTVRVTVDPEPPPPGGCGATNATTRLCETEESALLVAIIVTVFEDVCFAGAV